MSYVRIFQKAGELKGDFLRRQASHFLKLSFIFVPLNVAWFLWLPELWIFSFDSRVVIPLAITTLFLPIVGLACVVAIPASLIESVLHPRSTSNPKQDKFLVFSGILLSYFPVAIPLFNGMHSLISGSVHFSKPSRTYLLNVNSDAYWEGVMLWFAISILLFTIVTIAWWFGLKRFKQFALKKHNATH